MIFFKLFLFLVVWTKHSSQWDYLLKDGVCTLSNIWSFGEQWILQHSNINVYAVDQVRFESAAMHIYTAELCKTFPFLKRLYAERLSITQIQNFALHECKLLTDVSFRVNELESVAENLFQGSPNLQFISFEDNRLKSINAKAFLPVTHLQALHLGGNHLAELPINHFPIMQHLTYLSIHSNILTDLDEQNLVHRLPELKQIYIQDNFFDCDRLSIIITVLVEMKVELIKWKSTKNSLNANFSEIEGIQCVVNPSVEILVRKPINHSMIIGVGVLLILLNLLPVIGYIIWKKFY